jgi:arsenate reductase (thioredoxin)
MTVNNPNEAAGNPSHFNANMLRVLFVCVENANRSQMAQAFAIIHGAGRVDAQSAGSKPSGIINPKALRFMAEVGYDLSAHLSKSLDQVIGEFDAVVTMGCGDSCPWVPAKRRVDWALVDPKHMDDSNYRLVRDDISARVKLLLAELER